MEATLYSVTQHWFSQLNLIQVTMFDNAPLTPKLKLSLPVKQFLVELFGRPDGVRPHSCDTYLRYLQRDAKIKKKGKIPFILSNRHCAQLEQEAALFLLRGLAFQHIHQYNLSEKDMVTVITILGFIIKKSRNAEIKAYYTRHLEVMNLFYQKIQALMYEQLGNAEQSIVFNNLAKQSMSRLYERQSQEPHNNYWRELDLKKINDFTSTRPREKSIQELDNYPLELVLTEQ